MGSALIVVPIQPIVGSAALLISIPSIVLIANKVATAVPYFVASGLFVVSGLVYIAASIVLMVKYCHLRYKM